MKLIILLIIGTITNSAWTQDEYEESEKPSEYVIKPPKTYLVIAPGIIRAGRPFDVSISVTDISEPVQVFAIIKRGLENVLQTEVQVITSRPAKAKFMIPNDFPDGSYTLVVFGRISSLDYLFLNETYLKYYTNAVLSFIQTDKAIYKAKDLVRFRAINVDPDLKPYDGKVNISIYDAKMNKVKQWLNVKNEYGVISENLQLSDQTILGDWKIEAQILNTITSVMFTVEEYVLPKFEVTVTLPKYILWKDSAIFITVKAAYTFGKEVDGNVVLELKSLYKSITLIRTGKLVEGVFQYSINLNSFPFLKDEKQNEYLTDIILEANATVTEPVTNVSRSGSASVTVYKYDVKLDVVKYSEIVKPGLPMEFSVVVTNPDGTPLLNYENKLKVIYTVKNNFENTQVKKEDHYDVSENGIVEVQLKPKLNEQLSSVKIFYGSVTKEIPLGATAVSRSDNFIQIRGSNKPARIGEKLTFRVSTTEPRSEVNFVILSQERIISTGLLKMKNKTELKFTLKINRDMAPLSRMLLYYIRKDGEVIADAIVFEVEDFFLNKVTLDFCDDEGISFNDTDRTASPKDEIYLKGTALPNSFLGIAAVDQSVLLMKKQNQLTEKKVTEELNQYLDISGGLSPTHGIYTLYAKSPVDVFWKAGVVVMSNADIYNPEPTPVYHSTVAYDGGHRPGLVMKRPANKMQGFGGKYQPEEESMSMDKENIESSDKAGQPENLVRSKFPESWIWIDTIVGENGEFNENATVPDTITSWVASAISADKHYGLGISNINPKLKVFRPFFVSSNLPYSVVRGEVLHMQVLVFSYFPNEAEVTVELKKSEQFDLVDLPEEKENGHFRKIKVKYGKPSSIIFPIVPLVAGTIDISITGNFNNNSMLAKDTEIKKLLVKAEGVTQHFSSSVLIDLRKVNDFTQVLTLTLPSNDVIEGSQRAEVSASGDLFGNTLINLDNLVRVPGGCGEQNLVGFVSNTLILNYLNATQQLTSEIRHRLVNYLEAGYQSQLWYSRKDGAFSIFREDESGSTWLTAFVIKSFQQAKPYISFEKKIVNASVKWLMEQQNADGSFRETGKIFNRDLQGGSFGAVTLTAYIISALQFVEYNGIDKMIASAQEYLENQVEALTEPYSLAVVSYALTLLHNSKSDKAIQKLQEIAKNEGDLIYWSQLQEDQDEIWKLSPFQTRLIDIETTSYALLTYILRNEIAEAVPIAKWLNSKRNSFGGFQSTQDTVMGLEALTAYAKETYASETKVKINFKVGKTFSEDFDINPDNLLLHQSAVLPKLFKKIRVSASGSGTCLAQVSWQYNINQPKESDFFSLDITPDHDQKLLKLEICADHKQKTATGMVLLEVSLPSGYVADMDLLQELRNSELVKKIETENGDTKIIVYFSELTSKKVCLQFKAYRTFLVEKLKDSSVAIYEYYSPDKRTTRFYKIKEVESKD